MNISKDTVKYVADLARIRLSEEETEKFVLQLDAILGYIGQLKEVDITNISPTAGVLSLKNVKRQDIPVPSYPIEDSLKNAPQREETFFKVPKVI